jgi:probable F420-dependent oxidoreductase
VKVSIRLPVFEDPGARDPLRPTYDIAAAAEQAGFYGGFMHQHHFTPGYTTAPWVFLSAIAARTSELRLGTSIFLLPTHHPLEVAESVATLDRISGGRVILGAGIGYRTYEYDPFGIDYHRRGSRMAEALEILAAAWTGEPISYHGRHFDFDDVTVYPAPVQSPRPPLWVGAVARKAQQRAAQLGDGWMSDIMEPLPREQQLAERYRRYCEEADRPAVVCLMRTAAIASRRDDLEARWLPAAVATHLDYWKLGAGGRDDDGMFARLVGDENVPLPEFARDRLIAGTPDDCIEQLLRWHDAVRPDHVLLVLSGADPSPESTRAAVELFGREVIASLPQ